MCHGWPNQSTLKSDVKFTFSTTLENAIKEVWVLANSVENCMSSGLCVQMVRTFMPGIFSFPGVFPGCSFTAWQSLKFCDLWILGWFLFSYLGLIPALLRVFRADSTVPQRIILPRILLNFFCRVKHSNFITFCKLSFISSDLLFQYFTPSP